MLDQMDDGVYVRVGRLGFMEPSGLIKKIAKCRSVKAVRPPVDLARRARPWETIDVLKATFDPGSVERGVMRDQDESRTQRAKRFLVVDPSVGHVLFVKTSDRYDLRGMAMPGCSHHR
ncbi:hypothetical protein [Sphingomonas sp. CFBP 8760]|uniref:hypothetical protein n=1 Tax=Sphingomonas sp. CFBP 8760 TaxID=2775282 RepID=UPI001A91217D|nr:hypothetical protein [Sphingomonas sp. CFBP 8760]